ncbi:hypothetical protein [Bradyrhizobium sp. USDA 4474]
MPTPKIGRSGKAAKLGKLMVGKLIVGNEGNNGSVGLIGSGTTEIEGNRKDGAGVVGGRSDRQRQALIGEALPRQRWLRDAWSGTARRISMIRAMQKGQLRAGEQDACLASRSLRPRRCR